MNQPNHGHAPVPDAAAFPSPTAWQASWIEPMEDSPGAPSQRPAYLLRREFVLDAAPVRARVHATAHGIYELFVNGVRVGDDELTPGFTAYRTHLHVQTYDITDLLAPGANTIGAVLSDGWFRGRFGFHRVADGYGDRTGLLAELHADLADGTALVVGTDAEWRSTVGEITAADLMDGQRVDFRRAVPGWSEPGLDDSDWSTATVRRDGLYADFGRLTTSPAPPVRRIETLSPTAITTPRPGVQVVDFGQNINGWVRLHELGPRGTATTLTHGEALGADGDVTMDHLVAVDTEGSYGPGQQDQVISAGRPDDVFEPRHTTHGFRYVRVEGLPRALSPEDISAVVVHTDLRRTGWFRTSDERINRLHEAAVWSFRGNACDVPTDCPQRERAGFTGDWQIFAPTATFLYDVAGFSAKWLRDLAADQWPDGRLPNWAPEPGHDRRSEDMYAFINGSAGWGDAAVIVPWQMYLAYGDTRVLADQYDSMVRWVEYGASIARDQRFHERAAARPVAAPHEAYVWDSGFHWGEWLEPQQADDTPFYLQDHGPVATAYLYWSAHLLSRIADVLGRTGDAAKYTEFAAKVLAAWRAEFIRPDGTLTVDTQANHVRALAFGLVPDELRPRTAERLVALIRAVDNHLGTGFLSTAYLLPVLADTGHVDVAYELLFQDSCPSWLAMIDRGATTIWEEWQGVDDKGIPHASLNHYSKGAVVSFLHRFTAGIRMREDSPGYGHFDIAPRPGGGLTWAEAQYDAVHGRIATRWDLVGDRFHLSATVPAGSTATVVLPDGRTFDVGPGEHQATCAMP
ncbi:family 78 glycoside hydrolase catalytic domain [Uniformispora flossi]|uniref:family 78 glycoside hydrolase catalytic domain n=1 Tax=Uniformispora flossi TaxID=3390723 RepID=UPI003C2CAC58